MKNSDVTPFIIINIFISNCNLFIFNSVNVTDYGYIYFLIIKLIKLRNSVTCN